uniref:Variant surface glycoprotein 1203 n=1 Tax=Trypanosoma brucei TaxID=5691 RepID=M4SXX2_9TRYP|nr:variant surface glycoprotein 1203 [Trypanosoma brucei]
MRAEITGFVLFTLTAKLAAAQATARKSIDAVNTPCKEIGYLTKLRDKFGSQIAAARARQQELADDIIVLTAATALANDATTQAGFTTLLALTALRKQQQEQELNAGKKALEDAVLTLNSRIAQIKVAIFTNDKTTTVVGQAKAGTGSGNWLNSAEKKCDIAVTFQQTDTADCSADLTSGDHITAAISELKNLGVVKLHPDKFFHIPELTLDARNKGDVSSFSNSVFVAGACLNSGQSIGTADKGFGVKEAKMKASPQPTDVDLHQQSTANKPCANHVIPPNSLLTTDKAVANALCASKGIEIKLSPRPIKQDLAELRVDTEMPTIAQIIMTGSDKTGLPADKKEEIVDNLCGEKGTKVQQKWIQPLENKQITFKIGAETKQPKVSEVATTTNIGYAMAAAFYQGNQKQSQAATAGAESNQDGESKEKKGEKTIGNKEGEKITPGECTAAEEKDCDKTKCA